MCVYTHNDESLKMKMSQSEMRNTEITTDQFRRKYQKLTKMKNPKEKIKKKKKIGMLRDSSKQPNICEIGVPNEEKRQMIIEKIFKEIMAELKFFQFI